MSGAVLTPRAAQRAPALHRPQVEVMRGMYGDGEEEGNKKMGAAMQQAPPTLESPPLSIAIGTSGYLPPAGDGEGPGVRT